MSDKDKLVILILFFVFLASFFVMFKLDDTGVSFFQYLFFIAALTMAFTGFLGATGTFNTTGQTLGGGAAIFLVMVVAVVGLKPYFDDNSLKELVLLMKSFPQEKLSTNDAVSRAISEIEAGVMVTKENEQLKQKITLCQAKQDRLSFAIHYLETPQRLITDNDDLLQVESNTGPLKPKKGKYELSNKDLQNDYIYIQPKDNLRFGPNMYLKYDYNIPEIKLFVEGK